MHQNGRSGASVLVSLGIVALAALFVSQSHGDEPIGVPVRDVADAAPCASAPRPSCLSDMVDVAGRFCIDRYEASMVDDAGRPLSPYYPPDGPSAVQMWQRWAEVAMWEQWVASGRLDAGDGGSFLFSGQPDAASCADGVLDRDSGTCWRPRVLVGVPPLPVWQRSGRYDYRAVSRRGVEPSGYLSALTASHACLAVGKRLCTEQEWVTACRGEQRTRQPYGDKYREGTCNIHREAHPSVVLRGDWGAKLTDPRMNLMHDRGEPLLRKTGDSPACASKWGDDAIYDMVGNLDEWVENRGGLFLGGFYARATKQGCMARIWAHPVTHVDFSTGARCCRDVDEP